MNKLVINIFLFVSFLSLGFSCTKDQKDCEENLVCTDIFVTIDVSIENQDGSAVILDEYRTVISEQEQFTVTDPVPGDSNYPVISDSERDLVSTDGTIVTFVGKINNEIVIEKQFEVRDDCCHVELVQGETSVVL